MCKGNGGGWEEMEIFPHILRTITASLCQKALFLEKGSKWSVLCLAEH